MVRSAGWWMRQWVKLATVGYTLWCCARVIVLSWFGPVSQRTADSAMHGWAEVVIKLVGIRWQRFGEVPNFNDGRRYMLMCNHSSHYDIPMTLVAVPGSVRMLAKQELYKIPFFGRAIRACNNPALDRDNRQQAKRDLDKAKALMEQGIVLWMAPEGTRSPNGQLQPLKRGGFMLAAQTEAIVVPVVIKGVHKVLPAGSHALNLGQEVEVHIGQPLDSRDYPGRAYRELMGQVEQQMQALLADNAN
ncbi:lysophospholipid acyltransferase family protein [Atopomonas sediminilitoris]|uniref:lysophospholipid acyltransferase family protein n=1 Tax=Atopomonas sediminilitoris TaxID=2919919 RepID=UPI001F4D5866|nr:lysophospholipid acyltransferase family protein [Atopomonas sediminilitoris]MCJ8168912.1 1-acyl-sn-glycerol-3-phosphate acyltransferase [Atopomonas sediminilitoris]